MGRACHADGGAFHSRGRHSVVYRRSVRHIPNALHTGHHFCDCLLSLRTAKNAALWWLFAVLLHLQMGFFAAVFLLCLAFSLNPASVRIGALPATNFARLAVFPLPWELQPSRGFAREALLSRTYFFVSQWAWYEWVGVFAPLALLKWMSRSDLRGVTPEFRTLARALKIFGSVFTLAAIALSSSTHLENYTRLQPMRSLHLVYVIFFLLLGGIAGEYILRENVWRWLGLFVPVAVAMCIVQVAAYPASAHVEWPTATPSNLWCDAFLWIRYNTPKSAVFALDPGYMLRPGEDMQGFRAVAERSTLADAVKDSGAVSLFPGLADEWHAEVQSERGWQHFQLADFRRLSEHYPVTWFVVQSPARAGLVCRYRNQAVTVCQLPALTTLSKIGH
jgi:hypothetical protein